MQYKNILSFSKIILSLSLILTVASCTDLEPINNRLDNLEEEVDELKSEYNKLKEAWESYKVIADLYPFTEEGTNGGWLLQFTDGTTMKISHGETGETPIVKIDKEGYWIVSYDGVNYEYITDENGDKINAIGIDGKDGKDGQDGKDGVNGENGLDGKDGIDGKDGKSVRVIINDNGNYVFEIFDPSNPDITLESIETPLSADPSNAIAAIVKDDLSGKITFTMADGTQFIFELQKIVPSGIVILADNVTFSSSGEKKSFDIRINPSNVFFNYNVDADDCDIELHYVNTEAFYDNEGNYPVTLFEITPTKDKNENIIEGQYTVTLRDSGKNLIPYAERVYFILKYIDPNNETVYLTSNLFNIRYDNSFNELFDTGLPVLMIKTPRDITSKEEWVEGCEISVFNNSRFVYSFADVQMKGRGNSTWKNPKKPYAIKLNSKEEMLGMKKHKRWVLLTNYVDRTLMRNAVAFQISRLTDLNYTPDGKFVEVIFNGKHLGNYFLTEQIKVDKNRVDIAELDINATSGEVLTGGYLMELDKYYDEIYKFRSKYFDYPWMFKDPDEINTSQFEYMSNYVAKMEEEINKLPATSSYRDYLDIESSIDFFFVNELMMNHESTLPQSVYVSKDINGKIKMGPVWDFDWGTLISLTPHNFTLKNYIYYSKLFQDTEFLKVLKQRWNKFYPKFQTIPAYIDQQAEKLMASQQINYELWGCPEEPNQESMDYNEAVNKIKDSYMAKLAWLNDAINQL